MLPESPHPAPPPTCSAPPDRASLPRRRRFTSDPALFDAGWLSVAFARALRLPVTFYSNRPRRPGCLAASSSMAGWDTFPWFGCRHGSVMASETATGRAALRSSSEDEVWPAALGTAAGWLS